MVLASIQLITEKGIKKISIKSANSQVEYLGQGSLQ